MQLTTQDLAPNKRVNDAPTMLSNANIKELEKPNDLIPTKSNSLERLIASSCDCV